MEQLTAAVEAAAFDGGPAKVWRVSGAVVNFGTGPNPFDGMTITGWPE